MGIKNQESRLDSTCHMSCFFPEASGLTLGFGFLVLVSWFFYAIYHRSWTEFESALGIEASYRVARKARPAPKRGAPK